MPDLVSHLTAGYIIGKLANIKYLPIFLLGAVLSDIISRPFYILDIRLYWLIEPLHSPFLVLLASIFMAFLFEEKNRKQVFAILITGAALHLLMDLFQRILIGGYLWLFPFSFRSFSIGLFWPEDTIYFIPFLLVGSVIVWWWKK